MQGSEPNTPDEGAPTKEGERADVTEPAANEREEVETPQAASMARSSPGSNKTVAARSWRSFFRLGVRARWILAAAGSAAALLGAFVGAPFASGGWRNESASNGPPVRAAAMAATVAASEAAIDGGLDDGPPSAQVDAQPPKAPIWRVAALAQDPTVRLVEQPVGRRPLLAVLAAANVTPGQATRVTDSLALVRSVDRVDSKDTVTVALDKASGRVVAYELASAPDDVWQAREVAQANGGLQLEAQRLELQTSRVRVGKAVLVGSDLRTSLAEVGLTPVDDVVSMLDDALEGHAEISDIRPGARIRLIGTQEQVEGSFVRWVSFDAVEYFPANPNASAVRVYAFSDGEAAADAKHHGWYDGKGRQPFHGGYRSPVPLARIASRYNPHRMHPVLHIIMPHNGVDFAAPVGAPVYATAAGVVVRIGNDGPCGNKVEVSHAGGITSVYCHLSRYAAGLRVGQHVEQRQLIAYVGQTGRVTGPHLHFGIKKNGVFVDPMSLRLDGVRVVPRTLRDDFDRRRAELDSELDGIAVPPAIAGAPANDATEPEPFYEEP